MSGYVYRQAEPNCYTVGFYDPNGDWQPESDHQDREVAALRCNYLNGGSASIGPEIERLAGAAMELSTTLLRVGNR